jgi:HD-GYP domain-containing protein (c-di-GMP phosphodiesterase class II)
LHSSAGDEILRQIRFPFPVAEYVRYHHERWDGLGYPDGLKGENIPLGARILAIADAFDAIRSSRPYKTSFGTSDSIELLRAQSGTAYDPHLVELFIRHINELQDAANDAATNMPELSFRKYFETVNLALSSPSALQHQNRQAILSLTHRQNCCFCSNFAKASVVS